MVTGHKNNKERKKRRWKIIIGTLIVLLALRITLPYIILHYVNKKLTEMKEYRGFVCDIDIALIRGAYIIDEIRIDKIESDKKDTLPFFFCPTIDLSIEWRSLFKGAIVGELYLEKPTLNFVKGKHKNEDIKADTADFRQLIDDLMPLTINHFEIEKGQVHYIDLKSDPKVDIALKEIFVSATNLSNVNKEKKILPARMVARARAYKGELDMKVNFDALNKVPAFDLNMEVRHVDMVELNDFLRAYGNFDVKKGDFSIYSELAAKSGRFGGYVKPIIKDLDVVQWNKEEGDLGQILWETLIGSAAEILQNQKKEQLASKIPLEGSFDDPDANIWQAISYVLRNAFVYALKPAIDNSINIKHITEKKKKTFLEKVFGEKDKDENDEKKKEI